MKRLQIRLFISSIALIGLLIAGLAPSSYAQPASPEAAATGTPEQIKFSLNPKGSPDGSFFEFTADPGSEKDLTVEFSNQYSEPLALRSFVSDAYSLINGGLGVSDEGINTHPPTPWISYPAETYELDPGDGREITFTVAVPEDAQPGNYVSVLVLQTAEPVPIEGTQLFDQIIRKAIAIDISVPGKSAPAFTIGDVAYASGPNVPSLSIDISNTGNERLRPAGTMAVTDASGTTVLSADVAMGSIYADTDTQLQFVLQQPLPAGEYRLSLDLADEVTGATASVTDILFTVEALAATPTPSLVQFANLSVEPGPDPNAPQFVTISGTIANGGAPISNARLTLKASKDGQEVESFVLIPSLSLAAGETAIEQRYIPATGLTAGAWTFTLVLESLDASNGTATLLVSQDIDQPVVVS